MRIESEELPINGREGRDECLNEIARFRKLHPRINYILPQQVPFLADFAILAKMKEAKKHEIAKAFDDIPTIWLAGERSERYLSLSQAFAFLMEPIPLAELPRYKAPLIRILDEIYDRA